MVELTLASPGAVYSVFLFVLIGTYAAGSAAMFTIVDMVCLPPYASLIDCDKAKCSKQTVPVIVSVAKIAGRA